MNNRQRILKLLAGEKPDRVPWFADLDYWYRGLQYNDELPQKYEGDGYFQLNKDLGTGFYLQGYFPFAEEYEHVTIEEEEKENRKITTVETPHGNLQQVNKFLPGSSTWAYEEHFVKDVSDLKAFRCWLEHTSYKPDYEEAVRRMDLIGDNGVVLCYLPRSPFMEMVAVYSGIENLVYMDLEAPDEVQTTLELMDKKFTEAANIAVECPADCLMIPENLSSEVVGKRYYQKYMQSYETKWIKRIKEAGKYSFIHMDGTLKGLISMVADTGFDVLEALTPAPEGDLEIEEISEEAGPGPVLWGGLPGPHFTARVSDKKFDEYVKRVLDVMKQEPRFVLGAADQVPPDGLKERIIRVNELVEKYGYYK